jgi:hypothetical protein
LTKEAEMNVTIATLREASIPVVVVSTNLAFMTVCGSTYIIIVKAEKVFLKQYNVEWQFL